MTTRWVTWVDDEEATVELVSREGNRLVARLETPAGSREVSFEIARNAANGERTIRLGGGRSKAAWVGPDLRGERTISVDRKDIVVRVQHELDAWLHAGEEQGGTGAVSVAMPGRVVKLLAQVGDTVEKGQAVLIVEAMKMENEVKTKKAGVVQAIHVAEGGSVEGGKILMEIS